jgi:hypothetical protein
MDVDEPARAALAGQALLDGDDSANCPILRVGPVFIAAEPLQELKSLPALPCFAENPDAAADDKERDQQPDHQIWDATAEVMVGTDTTSAFNLSSMN